MLSTVVLNSRALVRLSSSSRHSKNPRQIFLKMSSSSPNYLAVHVKGKLTPGTGSMDTFYRNTLHNARNSILESGISRFDVLSGLEDPTDFLLIEVYNSATGPDAHKLTTHYNSWREGVADLMAQPRAASKYSTIFPPTSNWKTDASASVSIGTEEAFMSTLPWNYEPFSVPPATSPAASANSMLAVVVDVEVTEGSEEAFIAATLANCMNSVKEPGNKEFVLNRHTLSLTSVDTHLSKSQVMRGPTDTPSHIC